LECACFIKTNIEFENMNLAEIGDINEAVDKLSKIIEAAAKKSLQPVTEKKKVVLHRQ